MRNASLLFSLYFRSLGDIPTTTLVLSFPPYKPQIFVWISACLKRISSWMMHHLKLNGSKTELLYIPGDASPCNPSRTCMYPITNMIRRICHSSPLMPLRYLFSHLKIQDSFKILCYPLLYFLVSLS